MEAINIASAQHLQFRSSLDAPKSSKALGTSLNLGFSWRRKRPVRIMSQGFRDQGHVQYYGSSPSCEGKINYTACGVGAIEKLEKDNKKNKKRQMKLLKGISDDLLSLSQIGYGLQSDLDNGANAQTISEAAGFLLDQLKKIKEIDDEKSSSESSDSECEQGPMIQTNVGNMAIVECATKTKKKKMRSMEIKKEKRGSDCESSSSSSESSDSECDVVMIKPQDVSTMTIQSTATLESKPVALLPTPGLEIGFKLENQGDNEQVGSLGGVQSTKIEVCMGGKCKKSGAGALLEEFQRIVGMEGEVTACKCMGKCKEGPNVKLDAKSLCLGVGMEDVEVLVDKFLGKNEGQTGFAAAG